MNRLLDSYYIRPKMKQFIFDDFISIKFLDQSIFNVRSQCNGANTHVEVDDDDDDDSSNDSVIMDDCNGDSMIFALQTDKNKEKKKESPRESGKR